MLHIQAPAKKVIIIDNKIRAFKQRFARVSVFLIVN
jgi:hypothetical protein